jgi:DNA-binding Lrp family transcriptional regulator
MVDAYTLVKISVQKEVYGYARSVAEKLMMMNGVENAQLLFGDYDAITKLNAPKTHGVENLVIEEISMIEGIESTITLLCVDEGILE